MKGIITVLALTISPFLFAESMVHNRTPGDCLAHAPFGTTPNEHCEDFYWSDFDAELGAPVGVRVRLLSETFHARPSSGWSSWRYSPVITQGEQIDSDTLRWVPIDAVPLTGDAIGRASDQAKAAVFHYTNKVAMLPAFARHDNQYSGLWGVLETSIETWVGDRQDIYVAKGAYYPDPVIRINSHPIASHFYVVVYDVLRGESISFILPHSKEQDGDLSQYITSISCIEELFGASIFPEHDTYSFRLTSAFPAGGLTDWVRRNYRVAPVEQCELPSGSYYYDAY